MLTELRERGANLGRLKSDKQRRFVAEYLIDKRPKAAAVRAGYAESCAAVTANKLLNNPIIKAYIGKLERLDVEQLELDRHEALRQLYYALTRDLADFCREDGTPKLPHQLPKRCRSIVDGYKVKVLWTAENGDEMREVEYKLTPHAVAREQAMKHLGLNAPEEVNVQVGTTQNILAKLSEPLPPDEIEGRLAAEEQRAIEDKSEEVGDE